MAVHSQVTCDVCNITKQETNHWFRAAVYNSVFRSGPYREGKNPWADEKHACGAGCADALHHRFVTTGKLDKEMHPDTKDRPVGLTEAGLLGKKPAIETEEVLGNENQGEVQAESAVGRQEGSPPAVD